MSIVVDIHALQTIPPSLINRDDTGAPKTAIFGGVPRQRVSSQSWKRAIRTYVADNLDPQSIGTRSKYLPGLIIERVLEKAPEWDQEKAIAGVSALFSAAKIKLVEKKKKEQDTEPESKLAGHPATGYLLFLSEQQIERAVQEVIQRDGEAFDKGAAAAILDQNHSVDIAMFGRMLADAPAYNVDASVQVAHALSVHETQPDFDFFTAVDDRVAGAEESGAGMISTVQMMSSTLYRFATINVTGLAKNLGEDEAAIQAAGHFIQAFAESMPTGKQNTFANNTLPELLYVTVRDGRSISLVNAFEEPIDASNEQGRRKSAADAMAHEATDIREAYGVKDAASFVVGLGGLSESFAELAKATSLTGMIDGVQAELKTLTAKE